MLILTRLPGKDTDLSRSIRDIVLALAKVWAQELKRAPLPRLYSSGVFYQAEPTHLRYDEWADPYTVFDRKHGDCDDLVIWRLAEILIDAGYDFKDESSPLPAWPMVARKLTAPLYHVLIKHADGRIEDPSIQLMPPGKKLQ